MLFSKRRTVSKQAEEWCAQNNAPLNTFNIVTALDAIGYLRNEAVEQGNDKHLLLVNIREILIAIKNGDHDHFNDEKIERARVELKMFLDCDGFSLNMLLRKLENESD